MNRAFYESLYAWYETGRRSLPWRDTDDPYLIWISEVILQQTRVGQGLAYYLRFVERFPDIGTLATAEESEVLHVWQGLGYYSRARNIHRVAQIIVSSYEGRFPDDYEVLLSLPGIGEYTAGAIMSFAYNQPYVSVDGNAVRVLSRLFNLSVETHTTAGKRVFHEMATEVADKKNPRLFNAAFMELGELVCLPKGWHCDTCPVSAYCVACSRQIVHLLPLRNAKKDVRLRFFTYTVYLDGAGRTLIYKRTQRDIWAHLYEFPLREDDCVHPTELHIRLEHQLTHQRIVACFNMVRVVELPVICGCETIRMAEVFDYPLSRLTVKAIQAMCAQGWFDVGTE